MSRKPNSTIEVQSIAEVAASMGVRMGPESLAQLGLFAELFLTWNDRINLGGAISARELVERHFVDAFAATRFVGDGSDVVDVGSGGGLPAIPFALARPDVRLRLFEPTSKKVAFLRTAVRDLGLKARVTVHAERVLPPETEAAGEADVAMSRATWAPVEWLALGRRLIHPRGTVLVFGTGGAADPQEVPAAEWRYGAGRRLLVYSRTAADRST